MRTARRSAEVLIDGTERLVLCEPECRNEYLYDLAVPGNRNGTYRPVGTAKVHVAWSRADHTLTWRRMRSNVQPCDLCGDEWTRRPAVIHDVRPPTSAQQAARDAFRVRVSRGKTSRSPVRTAQSTLDYPGAGGET
jgi:hypothetical protein